MSNKINNNGNNNTNIIDNSINYNNNQNHKLSPAEILILGNMIKYKMNCPLTEENELSLIKLNQLHYIEEQSTLHCKQFRLLPAGKLAYHELTKK